MQAPICRLDRDVLHEIFKINAITRMPARDFEWQCLPIKLDLELRPLAVTRRTSHVCKLWGDIILPSSTIWAKCIDFDVLKQWGPGWRNLVIERAKESLLSITATSIAYSQLHEAGLEPLFVEVFTLHWNRIQEVNIYLYSTDFENTALMDLFCRPAPSLQVFILRFPETSEYGDGLIKPVIRQSANLFSNQAPSLVFLSCPGSLWFTPFTPLYLPSSKICYLNLEAFQVTARNFLNACLEMPHLEVLKLQLVKFDKDSTGEDELPFLPLPKLGNLCIKTWSFDIYPLFMDRINPASGCSLVIQHNVCNTDQISIKELDNMQGTLLRYANSFLAVHHNVTTISLFVDNNNFALGCNNEHFVMDLYLVDDNVNCLPPGLFSRLLDNICSLKFPCMTHRIEGLFINLYYDLNGERTHTVEIPFLLSNLVKALDSMEWVTHIAFAYYPAVRCFAQIPAFLIRFPALTSLSIMGVPNGADFGGEIVRSHLVDRQKYKPLQLITLAFKEICPQLDIRFMDELLGLTVSWTIENRTVYHTCGVDDKECLNFMA